MEVFLTCLRMLTSIGLKANHEVAHAAEQHTLHQVVRDLHGALGQCKWQRIIHPCATTPRFKPHIFPSFDTLSTPNPALRRFTLGLLPTARPHSSLRHLTWVTYTPDLAGHPSRITSSGVACAYIQTHPVSCEGHRVRPAYRHACSARQNAATI
jgi:hypothetical protein